VTAVSVAIDADAWSDWLAFLSLHLSQTGDAMGIPILPPLVIRIPLALAVVVLGALTSRRELIPIAMVLSTPVLAIASFTMLTAMPRLAAQAGGFRRPPADGDEH
jgi:hypothetical protein